MALIGVTFTNETAVSVSQKRLSETMNLILRRLNYPVSVEIELLIVGDEKIAALNKEYRQSDKPTDVLSFPSNRDGEAAGFIGSIVISAPTAKRQAAQAGVSLEKELNVLAGHGLLHLLGYHHA